MEAISAYHGSREARRRDGWDSRLERLIYASKNAPLMAGLGVLEKLLGCERAVLLRVCRVGNAAQLREDLDHTVEVCESGAVTIDEFIEQEFALDHILAGVVDLFGEAALGIQFERG